MWNCQVTHLPPETCFNEHVLASQGNPHALTLLSAWTPGILQPCHVWRTAQNRPAKTFKCKQECKLPRTTFLLRTQRLFIQIQNKSSVYVSLTAWAGTCPFSPTSLSLPLPLPLPLCLSGDKLKYCHSVSMMTDAWVDLSCGWSGLYQALVSPSCFRCDCYIRSHSPCSLSYWRNCCGSLAPKCISEPSSIQ